MTDEAKPPQKRGKKKPNSKLTMLQRKFVNAYLLGADKGKPNATKAAELAGFSPKNLAQSAQQLMLIPKIKAAIAARLQNVFDKEDITVDRILEERARLAFFNPKCLFNEQGQPIPICQLTDAAASAITSYEIDPEKFSTKIKFAGKNESLVALERFMGMYQDGEKTDTEFNIHIHI